MDTMTPIHPIVQRPCRVSLTAGPAAAAEARSHVRAAIHAWHVPIDPHVAVLLTSELVTNAIKHKADDNDTVLLIITWADDQMRVEVTTRRGSSRCWWTRRPTRRRAAA